MTLKVLVVDDEEPIRHLLGIILRLEGFDVLAVADGETALAQVREFRPRVVVLDIMMPGISGLDVATRLLSDPATADVRVLFLSALAQGVDRERGLGLGVHSYVTKPFDPDELVAEVRRLAEPETDPDPESNQDRGSGTPPRSVR